MKNSDTARVVKIDDIIIHEDHDVAVIGEREMSIPRDSKKIGDLVILIEEGATIPPDVIEHWGSDALIQNIEPVCGEGFARMKTLSDRDPSWMTTWWYPELNDDVSWYFGIIGRAERAVR